MPSIPNQPAPPTQPEQIQPPVIESTAAPIPEKPKTLHKRCKEIARELRKFIHENESQQIEIEGNKYARREAWQFVAMCYGVTPMVTSTQPDIGDDGSELGFIATANAIDARGQVVSGADGSCYYSERFWGGKPSFQLRSMAQTRACSKVLSNLFSLVMVIAGLCPTPAEEMQPEHESHRDFTTPCFECGGKVSDRRRQKMRQKYGQELCVECEKKEIAKQGEKILSPIADPKFVADSVAKVQAQRAQPIVAAMDAGEREYA